MNGKARRMNKKKVTHKKTANSIQYPMPMIRISNFVDFYCAFYPLSCFISVYFECVFAFCTPNQWMTQDRRAHRTTDKQALLLLLFLGIFFSLLLLSHFNLHGIRFAHVVSSIVFFLCLLLWEKNQRNLQANNKLILTREKMNAKKIRGNMSREVGWRGNNISHVAEKNR